MIILVTGAAGFIGSKLMFDLAKRGDIVYGIDNINDYYDVRLKYARLRECGFLFDGQDIPYGVKYTSDLFPACFFIRMDVAKKEELDALFAQEHFDIVVHLAAQAGVRYSITNPYIFMRSNMEGFLNILEACRWNPVKQLVFASSSSVYGMNEKVPYREEDKVETPVSIYAASKKSNELMAHSYSKLYGIPTTGIRYFTVYGPWGRPDMSPMLFADAIRKGNPIKVFNNGLMIRDFTYIDDIAEGTIRIMDNQPIAQECPHGVAFRLYNIGCGRPVKLMDFIHEIESAYGKETNKEFLPMQTGDVYQTYADTTKLKTELGYCPKWTLHEGIAEFMKWYKSSKNPLVD